MKKHINKFIGSTALIVFVTASLFGIACCGIHTLINIGFQRNRLFDNLYQGIRSEFWIEVILTFAMMAIIGIIFALFLARRAKKI